ncbi:MAG: acyltransferase [Planctomycetota bacterium]|nr:acyltransferase [Planctomycetota bacterium]
MPVHESSYIDEGVTIGPGTAVWHFCHIMGDVEIGRDCRIGQNVVIGPSVRIGDNVKIQNNVSVYRGVTLEDDVFCGPSMVFTNVLTPRSAFPRDPDEDFETTLVRRGATIGANATIVCGVTIGEHAMIGAGSVITRDVPAHALVYGNPAVRRGWACKCGDSLDFAGSTRATCGKCGRGYEQVGETRIERMENVEAGMPNVQ